MSPPAIIKTPAGPDFEITADAGARGLYDTEWLLPNGIGGFAMGTALGVPRRKYHGWLNAAANPPIDRVATVNAVEEHLEVGGQRFRLGGWLEAEPTDETLAELARGLVWFRRTPTEVTWHYEIHGAAVTKRLRVGWRRNTAAVRYELEGADAALEVRPLVSVRDFHDVVAGRAMDRISVRSLPNGFEAEAVGRIVRLAADGGTLSLQSGVVEGVIYDLETAHHLPDREDLVAQGHVRQEGTGAITIAVALDPEQIDLGLFDRDERAKHLKRIVKGMGKSAKRLAPLAIAADDFLVLRQVDGRTLTSVIAGYPWFADWGRDTMISLPGLMLATRRHDDALGCLQTFARHVSEGMIPNRFDDYTGAPHYNTVDASLWFLHAATKYLERSDDRKGFELHLQDACVEIVEGYKRGTRFGIRMDPQDALIEAGDASTQLTWMDAQRDGIAFTPRYGKAVEINALWIHGLVRVAHALGGAASKHTSDYRSLAHLAKEKFIEHFTDPATGALHDCLHKNDAGVWTTTGKIRPNQIFAASLKHSPVGKEQRQRVIDVVRDQLFTPVGLRTLAPGTPNYQGRFEGDMMARDNAYHNGTVWPWLIGAYCEAVLRAGAFSTEARAEAAAACETLLDHLSSGCLGQIAEIYDGDEPRRQEGCTAQAWSVAEVLRIGELLER